jgi:tellurite methyltransferase
VTDDVTWSDYYEANDDRAPRAMLLDVLASFSAPGQAVDLGCGSGIDTAAMLERGWRVFSTDAEAEAIDRLRARVPRSGADMLRTSVARMEEVKLPPADLVWAGFSLFFCDPGRFPDVWRRITAAVRPGGRFAGQLLGERDTWAPDDEMTAFSRGEAERVFGGWMVERFEEEENDGEACSGPKHWHVFHVVAQAPETGASETDA